MLPVVYAVSAGHLIPMHMDERQIEELLLTAAQSIFAVAVLGNLCFSVWEALLLFILFTTQLLIPDASFRYYYSFLYILLAVSFVLSRRRGRVAITSLFSTAEPTREGKAEKSAKE
jgi:cation:H+ antiporter